MRTRGSFDTGLQSNLCSDISIASIETCIAIQAFSHLCFQLSILFVFLGYKGSTHVFTVHDTLPMGFSFKISSFVGFLACCLKNSRSQVLSSIFKIFMVSRCSLSVASVRPRVATRGDSGSNYLRQKNRFLTRSLRVSAI